MGSGKDTGKPCRICGNKEGCDPHEHTGDEPNIS